MATLNRRIRDKTLITHEGGPAKRIDAISALERSVMSCLLWEDEFYEDGQTIGNRIADLSAQVPVTELARIAVQAKEDMRLRHVPLLLARELVRRKEGRALAQDVFPKVITRADDIPEFLAIYWKDNKDEPLAKQVKVHLGDAFRRFDEYQLQKYNGGSRAIRLRDAMRILRPKPTDEQQSGLWQRLIKGELATPDTWEVAISATKDKKAEWTRLLTEGKLGGLAMLRNLRNMREVGVDSTLIQRGIEGILAGRLLPINFIMAAQKNPQFERAIEAKFLECFAAKPKVAGPTVLLIDVSGSMDQQLAGRSELKRLDVACALGMIASELFSDLRIFTFSEHLVEVPARRGFGLRDAILRSQPHSGTYLGQAIRQMAPGGRFIVITDEQSHDPAPERDGYMINVASNKNGVGYGRWLHIDGWSDKVIDYILRYEAARAA